MNFLLTADSFNTYTWCDLSVGFLIIHPWGRSLKSCMMAGHGKDIFVGYMRISNQKYIFVFFFFLKKKKQPLEMLITGIQNIFRSHGLFSQQKESNWREQGTVWLKIKSKSQYHNHGTSFVSLQQVGMFCVLIPSFHTFFFLQLCDYYNFHKDMDWIFIAMLSR